VTPLPADRIGGWVRQEWKPRRQAGRQAGRVGDHFYGGSPSGRPDDARLAPRPGRRGGGPARSGRKGGHQLTTVPGKDHTTVYAE
jgi:hypothetical protein